MFKVVYLTELQFHLHVDILYYLMFILFNLTKCELQEGTFSYMVPLKFETATFHNPINSYVISKVVLLNIQFDSETLSLHFRKLYTAVYKYKSA